jgi:hypothetical protein
LNKEKKQSVLYDILQTMKELFGTKINFQKQILMMFFFTGAAGLYFFVLFSSSSLKSDPVINLVILGSCIVGGSILTQKLSRTVSSKSLLNISCPLVLILNLLIRKVEMPDMTMQLIFTVMVFNVGIVFNTQFTLVNTVIDPKFVAMSLELNMCFGFFFTQFASRLARMQEPIPTLYLLLLLVMLMIVVTVMPQQEDDDYFHDITSILESNIQSMFESRSMKYGSNNQGYSLSSMVSKESYVYLESRGRAFSSDME